jgi:hypothetical protein
MEAGGEMNFEPRMTRMGTDEAETQGDALGKPSGASEPYSLASKLAEAPVSESPSRFASGPALALNS